MDAVRDALRASASVPEGARAAIDGTVDRAAASLSKSAAVAIEALSSRLASVRAHYDLAASRIASAEDAVFSPAVARVAQVTAANPYASASALGACAVIALPGARRLLWRATVGRAASEEAVFNAASRSAETLRLGAESGAKELRRLRDQVQAGEVEMLRGQQKLRQAASRLRALSDRNARDARLAADVLDDLRSLPSRAAVQKRTEMGQTSADLAKVRRGADDALRKIYRAGVDI